LASWLHLRPCALRRGPWRLPTSRCPAGEPTGVSPLVAFQSPSRFPLAGWSRSRVELRWLGFCPEHPPLEFFCLFDAPRPGDSLPDLTPQRRFLGDGRNLRLRFDALVSSLVAGFHTRFGPPSPFPTTLTVCSPPDPVIYFNHSRPWGLVSPALCQWLVPPKRVRPLPQDGHNKKRLPVGLGHGALDAGTTRGVSFVVVLCESNREIVQTF
jgi:hypothetical protein